jgi:hypothetical protein
VPLAGKTGKHVTGSGKAAFTICVLCYLYELFTVDVQRLCTARSYSTTWVVVSALGTIFAEQESLGTTVAIVLVASVLVPRQKGGGGVSDQRERRSSSETTSGGGPHVAKHASQIDQ